MAETEENAPSPEQLRKRRRIAAAILASLGALGAAAAHLEALINLGVRLTNWIQPFTRLSDVQFILYAIVGGLALAAVFALLSLLGRLRKKEGMGLLGLFAAIVFILCGLLVFVLLRGDFDLKEGVRIALLTSDWNHQTHLATYEASLDAAIEDAYGSGSPEDHNRPRPLLIRIPEESHLLGQPEFADTRVIISTLLGVGEFDSFWEENHNKISDLPLLSAAPLREKLVESSKHLGMTALGIEAQLAEIIRDIAGRGIGRAALLLPTPALTPDLQRFIHEASTKANIVTLTAHYSGSEPIQVFRDLVSQLQEFPAVVSLLDREANETILTRIAAGPGCTTQMYVPAEGASRDLVALHCAKQGRLLVALSTQYTSSRAEWLSDRLNTKSGPIDLNVYIASWISAKAVKDHQDTEDIANRIFLGDVTIPQLHIQGIRFSKSGFLPASAALIPITECYK